MSAASFRRLADNGEQTVVYLVEAEPGVVKMATEVAEVLLEDAGWERLP